MKQGGLNCRTQAAEWPKRLPLSACDKILLSLVLLLVLLPLLHLAICYSSLPREIAVSYDAAGLGTEREAKWLLWILAAIDLFCTVLITACVFFPRLIDVPPLLIRRPPAEIIRGTRLYIEVNAIVCALLFGYMLEMLMQAGLGKEVGISGWVVAGLIALLFIAIGLYFYWLWRGPGLAVKERDAKAERLPLGIVDRILLGLSALFLLLTLVRLALVYGSLPDVIPTHYGAGGAVDASGSKSSLLIMAGVDIFCWILLAACNLFPQAINVPVFLLKRSNEEIIQGARLLMNLLALLCVGLLAYLQESTVQIALGLQTALSNVVLFGFIGAIGVSVLVYLIWLLRA